MSVLPVAADGQLGAATDVVKGVKAACVSGDPAGKFVFVCEPSADRVLAYQLDAATGKLQARAPIAVEGRRRAAADCVSSATRSSPTC